MNPAQSKAYESFKDEMVSIGFNRLEINASVRLKDTHLLSRTYNVSVKNQRKVEQTYPKFNYIEFREQFRKLYLMSDDVGMPIFVHYGTNRAVLDIPDRIRGKHNFDKLLSNLRIKRNPVRMVVDKSGKEIRVDMLSDGEKCTLALLGDLARRLILANPSAENPLEGEGIVLIDEIELHMHPTWQRRILHVLNEVFPNIQFIVTTHSPQVLGEVNNDYDIIPLMLDKDSNGIALTKIPRMDGYDSNMILEEYMETSSESEVKKKLVKILNEAIRKKDFDLAAQKLEELKNLAGETDEDYILSKGYMLRSRLK